MLRIGGGTDSSNRNLQSSQGARWTSDYSTNSKAVSSRGGPRCAPRDNTVKKINEVGRRLWKKEVGYHRQGRAENTFFRYKQVFGPRLHARHPLAQAVEAKLACSILNRMTEFGRPESIKVCP